MRFWLSGDGVRRSCQTVLLARRIWCFARVWPSMTHFLGLESMSAGGVSS